MKCLNISLIRNFLPNEGEYDDKANEKVKSTELRESHRVQRAHIHRALCEYIKRICVLVVMGLPIDWRLFLASSAVCTQSQLISFARALEREKKL